jgi:hypothetical protein
MIALGGRGNDREVYHRLLIGGCRAAGAAFSVV